MLRADGLIKSYKKRKVLDSVSLQVASGEVVGLLGPNGAGKTTCFDILSGIIQPDSGRLTLDGVDITHMSMYQRAMMGIKYLPQDVAIFPGMTVAENIMCVLQTKGMKEPLLKSRLDSLLEEFGLTKVRNTPACVVSGGERRKVEIARTLALDPAYIILDEPFAGIDPIAIQEISKIIVKLAQSKIAVILTDHNVSCALQVANRIYIICYSRILFHGTGPEMLANQEVREMYTGNLVI